MRTASYRVSDLQKFVIPIGFVGENEHCQIIFLADEAYAEYPHAAVSLTVRPPYGEPYPAVVTRDGNNVLWTIKDSDLTRSGQGEIQLSFTTGEVVAKTYVGKTKVCRSIVPTGEVPDPLTDFLTEAGAALTAIPETIAHEFEAIQAVAQTLEPGSQATAHFDGETKQLEIGVPEGEKGDPGYTPRRGVDYWTEADQAAMRQDIASDTAAARQAIADDKAAAELAITQDKNAAQQAISEDRAAAITAIGNKGTEQVGAVADKGAEVLASIPSDYTELSEDVSGLKSAFKPATDGTYGQILISNGDGTTEWVSALSYVYPEQFGAAGDGVTDDTDAIRDALEYAISTGKELRFMEKTYLVTPKYNSTDYCAYTGAYHSFTILENESVVIDLNNATLKIGDNNEGFIMVFFAFFSDNVTIKNGTLIGDRYNESYGTGGGYDSSKLIWFYDCTNVHIENLVMKESKGDAMGFAGREKDQTTVPVQFRDVYCNNTVRDCIMQDCQRNAVTITKGRGILFENCLMADIGPMSPGAGVDVEPAWGLGSVFDLTFNNCTVENAVAGSFFIQGCDGAVVSNCKLMNGLMWRESKDVDVHDSIIEGGLLIKSATGTICNNKIFGPVAYQPRDDAYIFNEGKKEIYINENIIYGSVEFSYASTNPLYLNLVEIVGNYIEHEYRTCVSVGETNKIENIKKAIVKNNIIKRYGTQNGNYANVQIQNVSDVDIIDNTLVLDYTTLGSDIIYLNGLSGKANIEKNTVRFERLMYTTYTDFYPRFLRIDNGNGLAVMINGNIANLERYVPGIVRENFIVMNNLTDCSLVVINNYAYKFAKIIDESSQVKACFNNILNDVLYSLPAASGVSF